VFIATILLNAWIGFQKPVRAEEYFFFSRHGQTGSGAHSDSARMRPDLFTMCKSAGEWRWLFTSI